MNNEFEFASNQEVCIQQINIERSLEPNDISVPPGYQVEVFVQGLNTPIGIVFIENGDMLIADDGILSGNPRVILLSEGNFTIIAEGFNVPITGINYRKGDIYVSHRGVIAVVKLDGTRKDIISGLPSYGDYSNTELELVAWGFRNPFIVKHDRFNRIFVANQGYEVRGSRPIANSPDVISIIIPGTWYGWPDYAGGELVTLPRFAPVGGPKPEILFTNHPSVPPSPFAIFPPYSTIMGLDFNSNPDFGIVNDMYIAEFGSTISDIIGVESRSGVGHRVTKVDMNSGQISTFAINKSGFPAYIEQEGGFSRPTDVVFGPDGAMYVTDYAITTQESPYNYLPNTGVIWRISKT